MPDRLIWDFLKYKVWGHIRLSNNLYKEFSCISWARSRIRHQPAMTWTNFNVVTYILMDYFLDYNFGLLRAVIINM